MYCEVSRKSVSSCWVGKIGKVEIMASLDMGPVVSLSLRVLAGAEGVTREYSGFSFENEKRVEQHSLSSLEKMEPLCLRSTQKQEEVCGQRMPH